MEVYNRVVTGELAGSDVAIQFPDVPCRMVWIKAQSGNATNVYIGYSSAVTVAAGTTDVTTGLELDAGEMIGPIPIHNLNLLWRICNAAGDDVTYMAVG